MATWKLTIKPDNEEKFDPFKLCKAKSIIGVGWSGAYKEKQATDIAEAKSLVKKEYDKWPYQIKYLLEDVEAGDHVWIHQNGNYYLCKANDEILFGKAIDENFLNYDIGHARKAKWVEIPEKYVSGSIQRGTIAQRMIQRIWIAEKEQEFHEILFKNLSTNKDWQPNINENVLKDAISQMLISDMFALMSPDDVEDVVAAYLQKFGWILIKSTCFRSKPVFEFMMLNKNNITCHVQVKSGKHPDTLPPENYKQYTSQEKLIYLFSTNKNPYPDPQINGVNTITHSEIFKWIQNNIWALTSPLKQRLWIFLCDKRG